LRWLQSKLLADENVPWPLVKLLRNVGLDVEWIPDTEYRGISDKQVVSIANNSGRIVLTRDSDFLKLYLRKDVLYGIIYIAEPVRKDNLDKLARNIARALEILEEKPRLIIVTSSTIESYPLIP
jgi:predicted nuclease of predicted toxin-antitoxin system